MGKVGGGDKTQLLKLELKVRGLVIPSRLYFYRYYGQGNGLPKMPMSSCDDMAKLVMTPKTWDDITYMAEGNLDCRRTDLLIS